MKKLLFAHVLSHSNFMLVFPSENQKSFCVEISNVIGSNRIDWG